MARAYSQDLQDRVIKTALGGASMRRAVARCGGGVSTTALWVRRARSGGAPERRQIQPKGSKLDPYAAVLLELVEASSHISHEMQTRFRGERGVSADIGTLWRSFQARAITVKKTAHACERGQPDVRAAREARLDGHELDPERLVFIDEISASPKIARLYGRCVGGSACGADCQTATGAHRLHGRLDDGVTEAAV